MFDEYGRRRPETYTPFLRSQHHALYQCTPEESYKWEQGEPGGAAKEWWAEVEAVKRLLPRRVKLRYGLSAENLPARLRAACPRPLLLDRATLNFLAQNPHSRCWSWARTALGWFVTDTTALGLLGAYQMHVLSTEQCRDLLDPTGAATAAAGGNGAPLFGSLLDVGAGEGRVTSCLEPLFREVSATDVCGPMVWRLSRRGYDAHKTESPSTLAPAKFDCVALLNVLDRCDKPIAMLSECKDRMKPDGGRLLLSIVIPYHPYVQTKQIKGIDGGKPAEQLPKLDNYESFEDAVGRLVTAIIEPAGLVVERIARVPYLCLGDTLGSRMYELDDAVLVCRARTADDDETSCVPCATADGAGGGGGGGGGGARSAAP
jgi:2-polyprenyl-3-methyl-5-hydroxy-6-metoxy-1,4-benzoquinol methylase